MACSTSCRLCKNLVISTAVAYDATTNTLNITIPNNGYQNCDKVCIVVAQTIPATTTISALVYIFVGASSFPLLRCNGSQVTASEIRTRTRYSTIVVTNTVSGAFRLTGKLCYSAPANLTVLPVTAPAAAAISLSDTTAIKTNAVKATKAKEGTENG